MLQEHIVNAQYLMLQEQISNMLLVHLSHMLLEQCAFKSCSWSMLDLQYYSRLFMLQKHLLLEHNFGPKSHRGPHMTFYLPDRNRHIFFGFAHNPGAEDVIHNRRNNIYTTLQSLSSNIWKIKETFTEYVKIWWCRHELGDGESFSEILAQN